MTSYEKMERVIDGGYCIGCGVCKLAEPAIKVELNSSGKFQAEIRDSSRDKLDAALRVCPFSDEGDNEDDIGERLFGETCERDEGVGYYNQVFAGHIAEGKFREEGASGGVISWVLSELLQSGKIDAVAHVKKVENPEDGVLFRYGLSHSVDEVRSGAKSRYYPIELSGILEQIKAQPGRYAVVGLPCFIKAVRRLAESDPVIKDRVVFCVGLVCGHLKSKAFADYFGWQVGVSPGHLEEVDFRIKLDDRSAGDYGVYLRGEGKDLVIPTRELSGSNWGHNYFRYSACDYCDDVFAETADIAIGDAWLPKYEEDGKGTSVVVVRNPALGQLLASAEKEGRVVLHNETVDQIVSSQAGGLRDRREGLSYRLYLKDKMGEWTPKKRVEASGKGLSRLRQKIYCNRSAMGKVSHVAWGDAVQRLEIGGMNKQMAPLITVHDGLYRQEVRFKRAFSRFKSLCGRILRCLGLRKATS